MNKISIEKSWTYLNQLVCQFHELGNIKSATDIAEQTLELARSIYSDNGVNNNLATSLNNLATIYQSQGKIIIAESLYVEALVIRRCLCGDLDNNDLATSINNLAAVYEFQGKVNAAEPLYVEALAIRRRLFMGRSVE
jgi:tetratricopeptide (TPR) repeat protein